MKENSEEEREMMTVIDKRDNNAKEKDLDQETPVMDKEEGSRGTNRDKDRLKNSDKEKKNVDANSNKEKNRNRENSCFEKNRRDKNNLKEKKKRKGSSKNNVKNKENEKNVRNNSGREKKQDKSSWKSVKKSQRLNKRESEAEVAKIGQLRKNRESLHLQAVLPLQVAQKEDRRRRNKSQRKIQLKNVNHLLILRLQAYPPHLPLHRQRQSQNYQNPFPQRRQQRQAVLLLKVAVRQVKAKAVQERAGLAAVAADSMIQL